MGDTMQFDLNAAILGWRDKLKQSSQFRAENLAELESHLRDAVVRLQGQELSEEEAFLIATRRIGSVEQLASEFEKVNRNPMNKIIHGLVLAFFSIGCWFLLVLLTLSERYLLRLLEGGYPPAFTRLCLELKPVLYVLPLLALAWCVFVWFRKGESRGSWVGFFAASASIIMLATFPTVIGIYLPLVKVLQQMVSK
jgi:hypothetical protein